MAPIAHALVGYLSLFLQLGVALVGVSLVFVVRRSLGVEGHSSWLRSLVIFAASLSVLAIGSLFFANSSAQLAPFLLGYMALEYIAAGAFIAGAYGYALERRPLSINVAILGFSIVAIVEAFTSDRFERRFAIHAFLLGMMYLIASIKTWHLRKTHPGPGVIVVAVGLALLAIDYMHQLPLTLTVGGLPDTYVSLETYATLLIDLIIGSGLVIFETDGARKRLEAQNAALAIAATRLESQAFIDGLTGSANRAAFARMIAEPPPSGVIAMLDLNELKTLNDTFGHAAGDVAICSIARRLYHAAGDDGRVFRIGGDEFVVAFTTLSVDAVRARIAEAMSDASIICGDFEQTVAPLSVSYGVAEFVSAAKIEAAVAEADREMYVRKHRRRETASRPAKAPPSLH